MNTPHLPLPFEHLHEALYLVHGVVYHDLLDVDSNATIVRVGIVFFGGKMLTGAIVPVTPPKYTERYAWLKRADKEA